MHWSLWNLSVFIDLTLSKVVVNSKLGYAKKKLKFSISLCLQAMQSYLNVVILWEIINKTIMKHLNFTKLLIILLTVGLPTLCMAEKYDSTTTKNSYTPRESGWYVTLNVEPVAANVIDEAWGAPVSLLSVSTGYQICPYVAVGGGFGYRGRAYQVKYQYNRSSAPYLSTMPVFLEACVNLNNKRVTPYFPVSIGYNIITDLSKGDAQDGSDYLSVTNAKTTAFTSVGFGMRIHMGKASTWNLATTLTAERFKADLKSSYFSFPYWHESTESVDKSFLLFGISTGFTF